MQQGIDISSIVGILVFQVQHTQLPDSFSLRLILKVSNSWGLHISIGMGIKFQDAIACCQIQQIIIEGESIDARIAIGMILIVEIAMITVITIKSVISTNPHHPLCILGNGTDGLRTFKRYVNESLRQNLNAQHRQQTYDIYSLKRLLHLEIICLISYCWLQN